ncbi:hypothetical protein ACHAQA_001897 [Verticillium albo-atrum]
MYRSMSISTGGSKYSRSYINDYPSPAPSNQQSPDADDYSVVLGGEPYNRSHPDTRRGDWYLQPEDTDINGEPYAVPEHESSYPSTHHDVAETKWRHYDYHATDEGGYWQIKPKYAHTGETHVIPHYKPSRRTAEDDHDDEDDGGSGGHESPSSFVCMWPDCVAKPFRRQADLQRHYTQRHRNETSRESFPCDHAKCTRRENAFGRLDHYRDHLRDYHKEDVCKRGSPVDAAWLDSRTISRRWWRCSKCVIRVDVAKNPDHVCPKCKTGCEEKRKRLRGLR